MVYAHQLVRKEGREQALLRHHPTEDNFGVQIAARKAFDAAEATRIAAGAGARFIDLNCGCPIHDTVSKGMGAWLLKRPSKLESILSAMVNTHTLPITVKLRLGYDEDHINIEATVQAAISAGVQAISIHGRTRQARYSHTADWQKIRTIAEGCPVPIYGNGDILLPYEARTRLNDSAIAGALIARGALIKPWIFQELLSDQEWLPTPKEQWGILTRFIDYLKEYFGVDELGRQRGLSFLTWHLDWFARYAPLPEAQWAQASLAHPLLQTRLPSLPGLRLPGRSEVDARSQLASLLWDSPHPEKLWERYLEIPVSPTL